MSEQNERTVADAADTNSEQLKQIKDEVGKKYNHQKLTINRVPDQTVEKLKELSYERFAGDYGMTLAFLVELHQLKDEFDKQVSVTNEKVMELQAQVQELQQALTEAKEDEAEESKVNTIG